MSLLKHWAQKARVSTVTMAVVAVTVLAIGQANAQGVNPNGVFINPSNPATSARLALLRNNRRGVPPLCRRSSDKTEFRVGVINTGQAASTQHSFRLEFIDRDQLVTSVARTLPALDPGAR